MQDSQNLSFPICKTEIKLSFSQGCHEVNMKTHNVKGPHIEQLPGKGVPICKRRPQPQPHPSL